MTLSIAVVCEARADQQTGCELADRVIIAEVDWLESGMLEYVRRWRGLGEKAPFLKWTDAKQEARRQGIRAHGHFDGKPGAHDAVATRRALLLLQRNDLPPDAVILLRDDDRDSQRRAGMEQARKESGGALPVVVGLAHPTRECWVVAGFEPEDDHERQQLDDVTRRLGFDPSRSPVRLSRGEPRERNAKVVLAELTDDDWPRQAGCWLDTPLRTLEERGAEIGLTAYLEELCQRLVPEIVRRR